jgi:hypothetical protein
MVVQRFRRGMREPATLNGRQMPTGCYREKTADCLSDNGPSLALPGWEAPLPVSINGPIFLALPYVNFTAVPGWITTSALGWPS